MEFSIEGNKKIYPLTLHVFHVHGTVGN